MIATCTRCQYEIDGAYYNEGVTCPSCDGTMVEEKPELNSSQIILTRMHYSPIAAKIKMKARLGSISPKKLREIEDVSPAVYKILTIDLPALLDT